MKQLVSILIPAFNTEEWISDCIESALEQTWLWKEIIVVDDGSKDSTFKIAKTYASPIVKVITQENRGAAAARNHALSHAQGDYIQWLDADDLLAPDKVARQLVDAEPGQSCRVLLSGAWGKFYDRPERARFEPSLLWEDLEPLEWLLRKIDGNLWMVIESWLVSRRLTEMAGPWDESMSLDDDGEYFCRVLSCSSGIRFIPESRCFCRRSNIGMSHILTLNDHKLDSMAKSLLSYIRRLRSIEESPRTRDACLRLLDRWAIYFYPERIDLLDKMQSMAIDLGGQLAPPKLRPKYQWLQWVFGWRVAKKFQHNLPTYRYFLKNNWKRILFLRSSWKRDSM